MEQKKGVLRRSCRSISSYGADSTSVHKMAQCLCRMPSLRRPVTSGRFGLNLAAHSRPSRLRAVIPKNAWGSGSFVHVCGTQVSPSPHPACQGALGALLGPLVNTLAQPESLLRWVRNSNLLFTGRFSNYHVLGFRFRDEGFQGVSQVLNCLSLYSWPHPRPRLF